MIESHIRLYFRDGLIDVHFHLGGQTLIAAFGKRSGRYTCGPRRRFTLPRSDSSVATAFRTAFGTMGVLLVREELFFVVVEHEKRIRKFRLASHPGEVTRFVVMSGHWDN